MTPVEVVQAYIDYVRNPTHAELVALLGHARIPAVALANDLDGEGFGIGVGHVELLDDGRFDLTEGQGRPALVVVARDDFGDPVDLVAFRRRGDLLASWIGAAALLGAEQVLAPRLDGVLTVHRTVMDWLRAGREGVVLLDESRAAIQLRDWGPFRAAEVDHGLHLQKLFEVAPPRIVVPAPANAGLAA